MTARDQTAPSARPFPPGLPLLLAFVIVQRSRGKRVNSTPLLAVVISAAVVWTVARNLPGFPLVPTFLTG